MDNCETARPILVQEYDCRRSCDKCNPECPSEQATGQVGYRQKTLRRYSSNANQARARLKCDTCHLNSLCHSMVRRTQSNSTAATTLQIPSCPSDIPPLPGWHR